MEIIANINNMEIGELAAVLANSNIPTSSAIVAIIIYYAHNKFKHLETSIAELKKEVDDIKEKRA